jgi:anti-anti-sigma factor
MEHQKPQPETVFFARPAADIVVIRIDGRGSNLNSPAFQQVADGCFAQNPKTRFIIDLENCPTMDSTFMGALGGISRRQFRAGTGMTTVVNMSAQVHRLLEILGLDQVLDLRQEPTGQPIPPVEGYEIGQPPELSRIERTIHMIQAHEELVSLDGQNEVRFEGVLQHLRQSLERQRSQESR